MNTYNITVFLEDTDAGGIVYHSRYLNYMERCRTQSFYHKGINYAQLIHSNEGHFVIKHIDINYLKPAYLGDELIVTADVVKQTGASITCDQQILKDGVVISKATVLLVFIDPKSGLPKRIPETLKTKI
jgi:acyl-CoA thioester hydrolase